jgi:hypothetical protein
MYGNSDFKHRFEPRMGGAEVTCKSLLGEICLGLQIGPFGDGEKIRC